MRTPTAPIPLLLLTLLMLSACAPNAPEATTDEAPLDVQFLVAEGGEDYPFSEAVKVGDLLFLSGQVGVDPATGELVEGGIATETRQTLTNIRQALQRNGAGMDDVVKCTVMLADIAEWGAMNDVYRTFFTEHFPARSALGASGLALGARVEIECIAALR